MNIFINLNNINHDTDTTIASMDSYLAWLYYVLQNNYIY